MNSAGEATAAFAHVNVHARPKPAFHRVSFDIRHKCGASACSPDQPSWPSCSLHPQWFLLLGGSTRKDDLRATCTPWMGRRPANSFPGDPFSVSKRVGFNRPSPVETDGTVVC